MDGFTLKEIVIDLRKEFTKIREGNDIALKTQVEILNTLAGIDNHLATLNSKTEKNIKKIEKLENETNRFKTIVSTLATIIAVVWAGVTFLFK